MAINEENWENPQFIQDPQSPKVPIFFLKNTVVANAKSLTTATPTATRTWSSKVQPRDNGAPQKLALNDAKRLLIHPPNLDYSNCYFFLKPLLSSKNRPSSKSLTVTHATLLCSSSSQLPLSKISAPNNLPCSFTLYLSFAASVHMISDFKRRFRLTPTWYLAATTAKLLTIELALIWDQSQVLCHRIPLPVTKNLSGNMFES